MSVHRNEVPDGVEIQTDKEQVKVLPCTECGTDIAVNVFYAAANAKCSGCKPNATGTATGSVGVPVAGKTDPAKARNLADCLVNPHFAHALCPVHPDDPEHEMELKHVTHNPQYGPSELMGYKGGVPQYRQTAVGETVMHQCTRCKATVSMSTTAQTQFNRQNEPRESEGRGVNGWGDWLGSREEAAA